MRKVNVSKIKDIVAELCMSANFELRSDIKKALSKALKRETNKKAKHILKII